MKTARLIKELSGFTGTAKLYELSEPLDDATHVVVSAADVPYSGPETFIFPADAKGEVTGWGELDGSYRGGLSHDAALTKAGYAVIQ